MELWSFEQEQLADAPVMATSPMVVDSGCGSSSESEVQPIVEAAGNKEYNALVDTTGFSTQQEVVGPFAELRNAIPIIERVQKLVVKWNKQQCQRVVDRYNVIAERFKSMDWDGNMPVGEAYDGGSRSEEVEGLLHGLQKGEDLISGYGDSQGTTNVVLTQNNPKAFKDHHEELDATMAKLGLQGMEYSTELTFGQVLKADAEADKEEMLKTLSEMPNVGKLAHVVLEKTTDVDVKSLVKGSLENLPSYLKISQDEIVFGEPVRQYKRQSTRDLLHEVDWAVVKKGKWLSGDFAIKVFNCGAGDGSQAEWNQRQLLMEVGSLVELQHPHVVRLVGFGEDEKQSIFVMELMDADLRYFMMAKPEPFTASEKLDIIFQIAKGMYYIHTKGYAHGDLKCTNIMVKNYGHHLEVKIGDLRGSQKRGEWNRDAFKQASKTRRPRWTAPEAIDHNGQDEPSWEFLKRMDIYSFGMTCCEIVTCGYPFDGERDEEVLVKKIKEGGRPTLPKTLDEHLKGLITSCWDDNPEKRPSFEDVCKSLDFIRSKPPLVEKDRSCGMVNFQLSQFKDINVLNHFKNPFKNIRMLDQGNGRPEINSDYAPEDLRIPKYLKIDPTQLTRGELIGSGGSATVYKTTWLRCTFAEKVMKKERLTTEFVQQEMNSLIKVSRYPCIAQLVGLSVNSDGACSIIMEYMDGNLRKLINTRLRKRKGLLGPSNETRPFELHEEMLIISEIALGMAYLHSRGLVHRDLNSLNVLAQEYIGIIDVKIADFGVSHDEEPLSKPSEVQTRDGYYMGVGNRFHRAPEIMPESPDEKLPLGLPDPSSTIDLQGLKRTDVFSFAMTCYEILTGNLVWPDLPTIAYAEVRSKRSRPKWPNFPDSKPKSQKRLQLEALVERCWQMIPEERPTFDDICKEILMIQTSS